MTGRREPGSQVSGREEPRQVLEPVARGVWAAEDLLGLIDRRLGARSDRPGTGAFTSPDGLPRHLVSCATPP